MRNMPFVLAVCSAVVVASAAPRAQAPVKTESTPVRTEPAQEVPAHKTMMLSGCLAAGSDASTFRLTNAVPNAQATAVQPEAVATSGKRAVYELKAESRLDSQTVAPVDLKALVGRQVEITARPDDSVAVSAPATNAGAPTAAPDAAKPAEEKVERLTVTTIKQLAASCR
jgi:hypothetical protein